MIEALKFWFMKELGEFLGMMFLFLVLAGLCFLFYLGAAVCTWGRQFRKRGK